MADRLTPQDFAAKVRAKYPGSYDDLSDVDLTTRVLKKYPQYADMVDVRPQAAEGPPAVMQVAGVPIPIPGLSREEFGKQNATLATETAKSLPFFIIPGLAGSLAAKLGLGLPARMAMQFGANAAAAKVTGGSNQGAAIAGGIGAAGEPLAAGLEKLAPLFQKAAVKQYSRVLAPTTAKAKAVTEKIVPELLSRGVTAGSRQALEDLATSTASDLEPQLDAAISAIPDNELNAFLKIYNVPAVKGGSTAELRSALTAKLAQRQVGSMGATLPSGITGEPNPLVESVGTQAGTIPQSVLGPKTATDIALQRTAGPTSGAGAKVMNDLESLKQTYIVDGKVADPQAVNAIGGVQDIVKQFGNDISATSLRRLRQVFDNPVAKSGGYSGADLSTQYALQAKQQAANSIREIISEASPDVAKLNKEVSFWLNVQKVIKATNERVAGQSVPLGEQIAMAAAHSGGIVSGTILGMGGHPGLGIGTALAAPVADGLIKVMRSAKWNMLSAVTKNSIANALASGEISRATLLANRVLAAEISKPSKQETQ